MSPVPSTKPTPPVRTVERRRLGVELVQRRKMSQAKAAQLLGVSKEAVRKWVQRAEDGTIADPGDKRGPAPLLSDAQIRRVAAEAKRRGTAETIAGIHALVEPVLHISASRSAVRRALIAAGLWP